MDKGKYKKLNRYHVIFLVSGTVIGFSSLTLVNDLCPMGYHQWVMVLIYGLIATLTLFPMVSLGLKYPGDNLFTINEKLLGKGLGKIINIFIILYGVLMISGISHDYLTLLQLTILTNRDFTLPLLLLLLITVYIVSGGIKLVARFSIISFFITFWIVIMAMWPITKGTITHLFPLFNFTLEDIVISFNGGYKSMMGYELIMFYFPYIINQKKAFKDAVLGIWVIIPIYLINVIACTIYFSLWQIESLRYPTLSAIKAVEFCFIYRIENILTAHWVFLILSTTAAYLWMTKKGIDGVLGKIRAWHLWISVLLIITLIFIPIPRPLEQFLFQDLTLIMGYGVILWPVFLLLIHKGKSLGGKTP